MSRHSARGRGFTTLLVAAGAVCSGVFWPGHASVPHGDRSPTIAHSYQATPSAVGEALHEELVIISDPFRLAVAGRWLDQPLVVQAVSNSTITFQALDSGRFENGRSSITVRTDPRGVAAARFFVARQGEYRVLASSPGDAAPAQFDIRAVTPQFRDDVVSGRYARHYLAVHSAATLERRQTAAAIDDPNGDP